MLTLEQREAFKNYIVNSGGFVGIHAAGGDFKYEWPCYVETLLGAQFTGHSLGPHIQQATLHIENRDDPTVAVFIIWG